MLYKPNFGYGSIKVKHKKHWLADIGKGIKI